MNLTLHLTDACNMACSYCTREKRPVHMSPEVLQAACRLAFNGGGKPGICFFGGEPMMREQMIYQAMELCAALSKETGQPMAYKMTTNGTLLTEPFLQRISGERFGIGLSFEGLAQDRCRHFADGRESFSTVEEKAKLLLRYKPDSHAMMTIAPQAAPMYAASVRYLYELGFRRMTATIAYGKNVHWTDEGLAVIEQQLREIAGFYSEKLLEGKPFYFSPLDAKIRDLLSGYNPAERCHLGMRQMPVDTDGKIYACTQFIGDPDYCLGDVFSGIDPEKRRALAKREAVPETCKECALQKRCTNSCGCMNRLETGDENKVSPLQCSYERMLIGIADETADVLYAADPGLFKQNYVRNC